LFMGNSNSSYVHVHFRHRKNSLWLISISMTKESYSEEEATRQLRLVVARPNDWVFDELIDPKNLEYLKKVAKYV